MARSIEEQVRDTYLSLRVVLAILAFALPPLLWVGGKIQGISLRPSMSAYYYATAKDLEPCPKTDPGQAAAVILEAGAMRDYFVGFLFAVGAILYIYKGYTKTENMVLNFAGLMAVGIALFPMPWTCGPSPKINIHGTCAILFFLSIALVCAFCSEATVQLIEDPQVRARYRRIYRVLAVALVLSPAFAYVLNVVTAQHNFIYWAEVFGIYAFSIYWVVKIVEISSLGSEKNAIERIRFRSPAIH
jgi:hypothetical protein